MKKAALLRHSTTGLFQKRFFYEVQDILDGRGRRYRPKSVTLSELPLRGFLICPVCGKNLLAANQEDAISTMHIIIVLEDARNDSGQKVSIMKF